MKSSVRLLVVLLLLCMVMPAALASTIREVEVDGAITPFTKMRIERAIDEAVGNGEQLVLIRMNTPGGLVTSMEGIVQKILGAEVPVVVWVGPSGAMAASAGFYILLSADIASMAYGTSTGAASVVYGTGGESKDDDIALRKATKAAAAMLRSITERRERNVEAAEEAVLTAEAYTETYCRDNGLIDIVANSVEELLQVLDGREIRRFDGSTLVLETSDPVFVRSEFKIKDRIMKFLATPAVAYLLLLLGLGGLYVEFTHPGLVFPAVVGVMCLILFALSNQVLPINTIGVLLILLSIVLFILEVKVVSYGMLTVGGLTCLIIGSFMLVDGPIPELRVPASVYLPASIVLAAVVVFTLYKVTKAFSAKVDTGVEGLVGERGRVTVTLDPEGKVFVHGEIWDAVAETPPIPEGAAVRVARVRGMSLVVETIDSEPS